MPAILGVVTSRLGIAAVSIVAGFLYGHSVATERAGAAALRSRIAALEADLATSQAAADRAAAEAESLREVHAHLTETLDAYDADLAASADRDACRLDGGDLERLRQLRR